MSVRSFVQRHALVALIPCSACQPQVRAAPEASGPPAPHVLFTTVTRKDLPLYSEAIASVDGYVNADIRARVRGYLNAQSYKEGGIVKANQRLFTIEPTEYQNAVRNARANLERAHAVAERNQLQLKRAQDLFAQGASAQAEIDNATASSADARAQVAGAEAQLRQAQLNLSYTQVRSPIRGVAGVVAVRVGNLVGQDGPTLLTTVSQIDPIRVSFPISELDYVKSPERFSDLAKRDLAWTKRQFQQLQAGKNAEHEDPGIELVLSDGSVYPQRGIVVTAARQIDPSTGTLQLQALLPNPEGFLRPGQYGRVRMRRAHEGDNVLTVPEKALLLVQGTYSMAVIGKDDKVQLRRVQVGPASAGERTLQSGVQEGERVVVEGLQKVSDGAQVKPEPAPQPSASAESNPVH